ncbi:MAG: gliding motility-associated C-terminal domain-containing protein, partial [Bacteroidetes bacterium]|nr:gliding motility-associated C-terminal domain-containing protein [Bacteroidota bacterium]
RDTIIKLVEITQKEDIPNAFTPDGDGVNDLFLPGLQLAIYNRWGQLLYEGTDGWDGTYKGDKLTPGTYFYILELKSAKNTINKINGTVTVVVRQ